jgi:type I restriction enzyme S subunit
VAEQIEICAYVGQQTAKFETLIDKTITAIGTRTERRTALIFAAVTGKIDVRGLTNQSAN